MHIAQHFAGVGEVSVLAMENTLGRDCLLLQRGGNDHNLESRTRLEHLDDRPVFGRLDCSFGRIIRVEGRTRGHGKDFACARPDEHRADHVRIELAVGGVQFALHDFLEAHVDGQSDSHAVLGRTLHSAVSHNLAPRAVTLGENESILPAQIRLHHHLHALYAGALVVEEAEHVPEPLLIRVKAPRLRFAHHAADAGRGQFIFELGHTHRVDPALYDDVGAVRGNAPGDLLDGQIKVARDDLGELNAVGFGFADQLAIHHHGVNRHVDGQRLAAAIGDASAFSQDDFAFRGCFRGYGAVIAMLTDLQVDETC